MSPPLLICAGSSGWFVGVVMVTLRTVCAHVLRMVCAVGDFGTTHGEVIDSAAASNSAAATAADRVGG